MSRTEAMSADAREAMYLRGRTEPTPAQRRRMRHKENQAASDRTRLKTPRYARLRRRFDRSDRRRVLAEARGAVAQMLLRKRAQDFAPKPWSKRQQQRTRRSS